MEPFDKTPQRAATRAPLGKPIKLQFDDSMDVLEGLCRNISIGGMFVEIEETRPQGSLVRFELPLDDEGAAVRGLGEVVWMRPKGRASGSEPGIGLKFRFLEQRDRQQIFRLVSQYIKERLAKQPAIEAPPVPRPATDGVFHPPDPVPGDSVAGDSVAAAEPSAAEPIHDTGPPPAFAPPVAESSAGAAEAAPIAEAGSFEAGGFGVDDVASAGFDDYALPDEPLAGDDLEPDHYPAPGAARRRPPLVPMVLLVLLVGFLAAIFFFRHQLFGTGGDEIAALEEGMAANTEQVRAPPAPPASTPPVGEKGSVPPSPGQETPRQETPRQETPRQQEPPPPAEPETTAVVSEPEPSPPPPPAVQPPAATGYRLVSITWRETGDGGLRVIFEGDGPITEQRYRHFRLDGDPPREVLQFRGVEEAFDRNRLDVGGPAVEQIRTGFHRKRGRPDELHVVLDLTAPDVKILERRSLGYSLELVVGPEDSSR